MILDSEVIKKLNDKELQIYNYILNHSLEFPYMSMRAIASENNCSTTVILNFTKKCGYTSFKELKYDIKINQRYQNHKNLQYDYDEVIHCLTKLNSPFYIERMNKAASILSSKENIFIMGVGNSGVMANYGARLFSSVGRFALAIDDPFLRVNAFPKNSAIIVLSVSGETPELVRLVSSCKKMNNQVVVITTTENSTLSKLGDVVIPYYISKDTQQNVDLTSQLPTVSILEHLVRL